MTSGERIGAAPDTTGVTTEPVIDARNLTVAYPEAGGATRPLRGFSLSIAPREVVGLVGDAGSGKSTAALAMMGLVRPPGRFEGGEVRFGGRDLIAMRGAEAREIRGRDIGIIVQNPRGALHPMHRVGRQIADVYRAHNAAGGREARAHAVSMLRMVGINDPERRADAYAHELSGGMAQRALIAMALSSSPRLLIADEPTSGLDVTIQAQFLDQMWDGVQETGSAILLVTQDLGIIANYCDRVCVLHGGRIVEDRPVAEFFAAPEHPYSRSVMRLQEAAVRPVGRTVTAEAKPVIEVEGLAKDFPVRGTGKVVRAAQGVDFTIREGETLGLVGESGSGKTTVGRCLMRLEEPTGGAIRFRGEPIADIGPREMMRFRARMQIVFQDPYDSLNPRWTIERILREPLDLHTDLTRAQKHDRAVELLELVGINPALLKRHPRGLGAGTVQRLCIARALATNPEFIVLDEPTSVLTPAAIAGLVELLADLQQRLGLGYLFISHDLTTVRAVASRMAVMYLGQIVETGPAADIFAAPSHPYSRALIASHLFPDPADRRVDRPVREALTGEIPSPIDLPSGCYLAGRCPFAVERCRTEPQTLQPLADGRTVRCWRAVAGELPEMERHGEASETEAIA